MYEIIFSYDYSRDRLELFYKIFLGHILSMLLD